MPFDAIILIRIATAVTMVAFGVDQLINPRKWTDYIPDFLSKISPLNKEVTMRLHALGNIGIGLWFVSGFLPHIAVVVTLLWWISILPFAFLRDWRIGLRDLTIIAGIVAVWVLL